MTSLTGVRLGSCFPVPSLTSGTQHFGRPDVSEDRKSTRLNSSHSSISYAVFCLKKKNYPQSHILPIPRRCPSLHQLLYYVVHDRVVLVALQCLPYHFPLQRDYPSPLSRHLAHVL